MEEKGDEVGVVWSDEEPGATDRSECDCLRYYCGGGGGDCSDREAEENPKHQTDPNSDQIETSAGKIAPKRSSYNSN